MSKFIPLHIISGYSLLNSGLTIDAISSELTKKGFPGAAITDIGVLSGIPHLFDKLSKANQKPLVGLQVEIDEDVLCLFAINEEGYNSIVHISSYIQQEKDFTSYLKDNHKGVIGVLETIRGKFHRDFLGNEVDIQQFSSYLFKIQNLVEQFYLGIEIISEETKEYATKVRNYASSHSYECIAFPRIRYKDKTDAAVIPILQAIQENGQSNVKELNGPEYFMYEPSYHKLYTEEEIANTEKVLNSSTFDFNQKRGHILNFTDNPKELLKVKAFEGLKIRNLETKEYIDRLNHELEVISSLGYDDYFLIVQDYVNYAKNNDILVGPGRGSAAGSLVSYCIGITNIDPIKHNLQFERFLNSARKTMPDIDMDFMDNKRNDVVEYIRKRFGEDKVAVISTFQTIKAKQAIRDIGRVFSYPTHHIDLLSKSLTEKDLTLRESYKKIPQFRKYIDDDPYFLEIVKLAQKIEGLPRQKSNHPAGVILNDKPIIDSLPIFVDPINNDWLLTQYETEFLEAQGFLKMDILALGNLTTIDLCTKLVNAHNKTNYNSYCLPFDDRETYQIIADRQTAGIFQLESAGMKRAISLLKPKCFDDIVALLALFRPGPMDELSTFVARRNGQKFTYISKDVENILSSTYGVIVYQEQINELAKAVAGFTMEEADIFRRAVSKKKKAIFKEMEEKFINGSIANGYSENQAHDIFAQMTKFEDYGFNKSHAVAYAMIACETAWLKAKYPLEFYSSILNTRGSTSDTKLGNYLNELTRRGYKILPPNVNKSTSLFTINDKSLLFPLIAIRNVSDILSENIVLEREKEGSFKSYYDFVTRMYPYRLTPEQLTNIIYSGALDEFCPSRLALKEAIPTAFQHAQLFESANGQLKLDASLVPEPKLPDIKDDEENRLSNEFEVLGMTLSSNPLEHRRQELTDMGILPINEAISRDITTTGIIRSVKLIHTKKKERMAYISIFDETGDIEVVIFPKLYLEISNLLENNNKIIVKGNYKDEGDNISIIADEIKELDK